MKTAPEELETTQTVIHSLESVLKNLNETVIELGRMPNKAIGQKYQPDVQSLMTRLRSDRIRLYRQLGESQAHANPV